MNTELNLPRRLCRNPVIYADWPDPDVIRVGGTYYMISTTMHFFPGAVILRSFNLVDWEILTYITDDLDGTSAQKLEDKNGIYGKGMWAASLRFHEGKFHAAFVANDTGKTYLYTAEKITGPWKKSYIEGFYHDSSLLFDDDGRVYIAYGNREIRILELESDLSGPKKGGLSRVAVTDSGNVRLGYEGTHFYKINGKYYLFFIHWPAAEGALRTEACFCAESIDGIFRGGDVICSDLDARRSGVAQGGIVDTPDGHWYSMLFQDHGAVGRIPVLVPVSWKDGFPCFGEHGSAPKEFYVQDNRPGHKYEPLFCSGIFDSLTENGKVKLKKPWQWNHIPDGQLWSMNSDGALAIKTGRTSVNLMQARNILTQRAHGEKCSAEVTVDASAISEGDFAGLCAFIGRYGFVGITRRNGRFSVAAAERASPQELYRIGAVDTQSAKITEEFPLAENSGKIRLRLDFDFSPGKDTAEFYYMEENSFRRIGPQQKLVYGLDHFCGVRFGLFIFSTETPGGQAEFSDFRYYTED